MLIVFRIEDNKPNLVLLARRSIDSIGPFEMELGLLWIPYWKADCNYIVAGHFVAVAEISWRRNR